MALDPATPPPPLSSVTKLVTHTCQGMALLPLWFPSLKALSCDAANATLRDISRLVRRALHPSPTFTHNAGRLHNMAHMHPWTGSSYKCYLLIHLPHSQHLQTSLQHLLLWQPLCMPGAALGDVGLRHLTGLTLLRELRLEGADGLTDAGWAE